MRTFRRSRRVGVVAALASIALLAGACGGDDDSGGGSGGGGDTKKGTITVGSGDLGESQIVASAYIAALKKAGYDVKPKLKIGTREVYLKSLEAGEVDVVPEYVGTLTDYLQRKYEGPDSTTKAPKASGDLATTYTNLQALAAKGNLIATPASPAVDQNAFAVTKEFSEKNGVTKTSDLAKLSGQIVLGAGPDCPKQSFCVPGLKSTYGVTFKDFKAYSAGGDSDAIYGALKDGTIQVGLVFSSSGRIAEEGVVVLEDDKHLQTADNITALARKSIPTDAQDVINKVNQAITTEKLQKANGQSKTEDPEDLAEEMLEGTGLI